MTKFGIFPHGLSLGQGNFRPALIFKDKKEAEVLPVWLDPLEANLLLADAQNDGARSLIHRAPLKIFGAFKIKLRSIYFDEVTGSSQYATVVAEQDGKSVNVRMRAGEAMSLAMNAGCTFYTNRDVIEKSRQLTIEHLLHMEPVGGKGGETEFVH